MVQEANTLSISTNRILISMSIISIFHPSTKLVRRSELAP